MKLLYCSLRQWVVCASVGVGSILSLCADLVLDIKGTPGSPVISFEASGSLTIVDGVPAVSSIGAYLPRVGWHSTTGGKIGPFVEGLQNLPTNSLVDYRFSNPIPVSHNQEEFVEFDFIRITDRSGDDDSLAFYRDHGFVPVVYPALVPGDTVSWSGSGSFVLDAGDTFDNFILGSFSNPLDGGNLVLNVSAVPEPRTYVLLSSLALGGLVVWRRRQGASVVAG